MRSLTPGITVVVPTIPPRVHNGLFNRATDSINRASLYLQDKMPGTIVRVSSVIDARKIGAARSRQLALENVDTTWTAFLDDDDEMLPDHLYKLMRGALEHGADYVWSRFRITYPGGACLTGPAFLGAKAFQQWNDDDPCQTTITTLVRTELAMTAGGFAQFDDDGSEVDGQRRGEDHEFTVRCRKAGGVFRHVPEVTWLWHHHENNTSGLPDRW